jgi:DNA repair protein RecO (recombination protein O)
VRVESVGMGLVNDRCICLRKVEYSETSQVLTLLARGNGLLKVIAKGAHRVAKNGSGKFGGGVDLMDVGEATFSDRMEKELLVLTEWKLAEGHRPLRSSLRGLWLGFYACELASLLIELRDPHPAAFDGLERLFGELATPRAEQGFLAFELDLLRETGYLPEFLRCRTCGAAVDGRRGMVGFDAAAGGVICGKCQASEPRKQRIDGRLIGVLHNVLRLQSSGLPPERLPMLTRHQTDPINRLLSGYVQQLLGRGLRMEGYVMGTGG